MAVIRSSRQRLSMVLIAIVRMLQTFTNIAMVGLCAYLLKKRSPDDPKTLTAALGFILTTALLGILTSWAPIYFFTRPTVRLYTAVVSIDFLLMVMSAIAAVLAGAKKTIPAGGCSYFNIDDAPWNKCPTTVPLLGLAAFNFFLYAASGCTAGAVQRREEDVDIKSATTGSPA